MRHTLGIQTDFAVCMVGEFADRKDFATYLAAAQKILDRRRDVTFLAVGDGPTLPACKALLRPENADRVMFTGWRTDVEDIVHCTDIGVLATFTEGISNSILEYMALGKPVVATDGGGTNEIVGDGLTGYLVPREDATALSDAIVRLLDHPDDAQRMGEAGRCVVRDRFSIGTMVQAYMNLYSGLHPEGMHRALVLG
jgi:glycosyltransferase involved in cell wall biosynthesis